MRSIGFHILDPHILDQYVGKKIALIGKILGVLAQFLYPSRRCELDKWLTLGSFIIYQNNQVFITS